MEPALVAIGHCTLTGHVSVAENTDKLVLMIETSDVPKEGIVRRLEEMVRSTKAREALAINQDGLGAQISYLFTSRNPMAIAKKAIQTLVNIAKTENEESLLPVTAPETKLFPQSTVEEETALKKESARRYRR
jgi:aryl-alcohol dehydrogenase-like predicted oxidoreductase